MRVCCISKFSKGGKLKLHLTISDVMEARHGWTHLGTSCQNLLVITGHILHLNVTDGFGGQGFVLDLDRGLQTLSKSFPFPLSLGTLHSDAYCTLKHCISPMSQAKKSLDTF